jgi:hypothetical protein
MSGLSSINSRISSLSRSLQVQKNNLKSINSDPSKSGEQQAERIRNTLTGKFPTPTHHLNSAFFKNGTYRIRTPGYYILDEDIVFDPPELQAPTHLYAFPPYQLGFFAAVTIETNNVILDLNGHCIRQSKRHALLQRFFAVVELSSQPFNSGMGPSSFNSQMKAANTCWVKNGYLGLSSHHGFHNAGRLHDVLLEDLHIFDFEVAGIHLNGAHSVHLERIHIGPVRTDCNVNALFSQAIFAKRSVHELVGTNSRWRDRDASDIMQRLQSAITATEQNILKGNTAYSLFHNETGLPDGNVYGIVVHGDGVVVGPLQGTPNEKRANHVTISEVCIEGMESIPMVFKALSFNQHDTESYGSGGRVHTGPVGDVIEFSRIVSSIGKYIPNVLSEAQFLCAKYNKRTAKAADKILHWAENHTDLRPLLVEYPYGNTRDAMDHVMKGNFGLFVTNASNVILAHVIVCDVFNRGKNVVTDSNFRGNDQSAIIVDGCTDVTLSHHVINSVGSVSGNACGIEIFGKSNVVSEEVNISRVSPMKKGCAMMKMDKRSKVTFQSGHQPARVSV